MSSETTLTGRRWIPDSEADNCMICGNEFGLFLRRHHCRSCGRVLCKNCSSQRAITLARGAKGRSQSVSNSATEEKDVRICDDCHVKLASDAQMRQDNTDGKLYDTFTACATCSFVDRKGLKTIPAEVVQLDGKVYLQSQCAEHGELSTLLCSSAAFFNRMHGTGLPPLDMKKHTLAQSPLRPDSVQPSPAPSRKRSGSRASSNTSRSKAAAGLARPSSHWARSVTSRNAASAEQKADTDDHSVPDMEDMYKEMAAPSSLPMVVQIELYRGHEFVPNAKILNDLQNAREMYPRDYSFIIRFVGGLVPMELIPQLNQKLLELVDSPALKNGKQAIVLELSADRHYEISALDDSILLRPRVYPAVRYFLVRGEEERCLNDLNTLIEALKTISHMNVVLTLSVDRPYPHLTQVMQFVRERRTVIRVVMLSRERSPRDLLNRLVQKAKETAGVPVEETTHSEESNLDGLSTDPYELLQWLEEETMSSTGYPTIRPSDFLPLRIGKVLEPLLRLVGWNIQVRAAPFCGMAALLITGGKYVSKPVSQLLDMHKLHHMLEPLATQLEQEKISVWLPRNVKKALTVCALPGVDLPDLSDYVKGEAKGSERRQFVDNLQLLVLHNNMDIDSIDVVRRCQCAVVTPNAASRSGSTAACTGCL